MTEAESQFARGQDSSGDFADLVAGHLAGELSDAQQKRLTAELAALPDDAPSSSPCASRRN